MKPLTKTQEKIISKAISRGSLILNKDVTKPVFVEYKEPLDSVREGYGFYGVLTYNENKTHVQCHICGNYFRLLSKHVSFHEITSLDYKLLYGFAPTRSLVGEATAEKMANSMAKMYPKNKDRIQKALKDSRANRVPGKPWAISLEQKNLKGKCPVQLLDKIKQLETILCHTPSEADFNQHYKGFVSVSAVKGTFGKWSTAVELAGFSLKKNPGNLRYSRLQLMKMINNFVDRHNRMPGDADCRAGGELPSTWVWWKHFGGIVNAREVYRLWKENYQPNENSGMFMDDKEWEEWWSKLPKNKEPVNYLAEAKKSQQSIIARYGMRNPAFKKATPEQLARVKEDLAREEQMLLTG